MKSQQSDGKVQEQLKEFESPTFGYRMGKDGEVESCLFDGKLPKGWFGSQADFDKKGKKIAKKEDAPADDDMPTVDPDAPETDDPEGEAEEGLKPPYTDHNRKTLMAEVKRRLGKTPMKASVADLIETLTADDVVKSEE